MGEAVFDGALEITGANAAALALGIFQGTLLLANRSRRQRSG